MIHAQFRLGGEMAGIVIKKNDLLFQDVGTGAITTITGLKLSKAGVWIEHPDLKDNSDWRLIAIDRLKLHMKSYDSEMEKLDYIKKELIKFGYEPLHYQRAGFRPKKFKDEKWIGIH